MENAGDVKNMNIYWNKVNELQDALLRALEKQPLHSDEIKDLQETVAEILLLSDK